MAEPKIPFLSPNTLVPISSIVMLLTLGISAYIWMDSKFDLMINTQNEMNTRILLMDRDVKNAVTREQAMRWVGKFQQDNPTMQVPDVE